MSFPRYPKYKDSGVEWLGDVPEHWETRQIKRVATIRYGIGEPPKYHDEGTPLIRATNVHAGKLFPEGMVFVDPTEIPAQRIVWLQAGDIIVVRSGAYTGDSAIIPEGIGECIAGFDMVLRCHAVRPLFIQFSLLSSYLKEGQIDLEKMRAAQPHLNAEELGSCIVVLPSEVEQERIEEFLEAETSKIDELVAEQRRLIELLKEKRQAVISHAVTKGLNPNAPMKPSGIEWLGDVPEHWMVKPLGRLGQLQNGLNIGGEAFGAGDPFVSYGDVYKNANVPTIPSGLVLSTSSDQEKYDLDIGDVLFTRTSETVDDIGVASTCLCPIPRVTFAGFLIRFRPIKGLLEPRYSTFLFRNQGVQGHFSGTMNLVTRASLSQEVLKLLPICVPPIMEQQAIAQFIEQQVAAFCDLIAEATRAVELLQERRTALISAAVTGKIDVRSFATQIPEVA